MSIHVALFIIFSFAGTTSLSVTNTEDFQEWWQRTPVNDTTKQFLIEQGHVSNKFIEENIFVSPDTSFETIVPNKCFGRIESPVALIYCIVFALIWLAVISTGLFFYFKRVMSAVQPRNSTSRPTIRPNFEEETNNGQLEKPKTSHIIAVDSQELSRLLPVRQDTGKI
jgi:hypothetical protein